MSARGVAPGRWLSRLRSRPRTSALVLGALAALTLPPFHLYPLLLAFAGLVDLLRRTERGHQALVLGWCFGFAHFLLGLYWIGIAFFTDAERFGVFAVPAVLLLCAYLACFPALAAWLTVLYRWQSPIASTLVLALAWTATEFARGLLFGGFPWNLIGYAFAPSAAISQLAALAGVHGLSLLAVTLGALPAAWLDRSERPGWEPLAVAALALIAVWAGGALRLLDAVAEPDAAVRLRLVQGNVAQHHKWQPEARARAFERHLSLSAEGAGAVTHVIWPESATPYPLEQEPVARQMIAEVVPPDGLLLTGGERYDLSSEPPRVWNSLFVIDDTGTIRARYDKRDLVPFGEFLPLRDVLSRLGLDKLTHGSIDFRAGPGRQTIALPGLPPFSPLICYEAIFSGGVVDPGARPDWLLNITNDAWFGRSSGPYQHFAMARMRAIEEGLPLVRSANTGISAVVDPWGRIQAELGLGETGVLDAALPRPLPGATPFARTGPVIVAVPAAMLALGALLLEVRRRRGAPEVTKAQKAART
ncbi:MAG: apolipoprotein N-acyltransferase [Geminicoccaceae bacterium]